MAKVRLYIENHADHYLYVPVEGPLDGSFCLQFADDESFSLVWDREGCGGAPAVVADFRPRILSFDHVRSLITVFLESLGHTVEFVTTENLAHLPGYQRPRAKKGIEMSRKKLIEIVEITKHEVTENTPHGAFYRLGVSDTGQRSDLPAIVSQGDLDAGSYIGPYDSYQLAEQAAEKDWEQIGVVEAAEKHGFRYLHDSAEGDEVMVDDDGRARSRPKEKSSW